MRGALVPSRRCTVAWLALAAAILHMSFVNLRQGSVPRSVLGLLSAGAVPAEAEQDRRLDSEFAAAAGDGNLFLRFLDFDSNPAAQEVLSGLYYRAVYSLYPRRVLVSREGDIINNGRDLVRANFEPDAAWLARRDVRAVMTFRPRPDGSFEWRVQEQR